MDYEEIPSARIGNGEALRKRAAAMDKPKNPYKKGTIIWAVIEGDWEANG